MICKCRRQYRVRQTGSWDDGAWVEFPNPPAQTDYDDDSSDDSIVIFPEPPVHSSFE